MRKIIAALQMSLDGFIEDPHGELDWVHGWEDVFDLLPQIDTCILGRRMYPGYEQFWRSILADPTRVSPFTDQPPSPSEVEYAHFADRTPHVVVSKTLPAADWHNTRIVRDIDEIRRLKQQPGKDIHAVGGATLVSSLMNAGLIDELRIVVLPIVLGGGTPLFKDVKQRHALTFVTATPLSSGLVRLTYRT